MYCRHCGFITKGVESKCPYCGTPYVEEDRLDKKRFPFNWFAISLRQTLFLLGANAFLICSILDAVLALSGPKENFHLSFYSYVLSFGVLFLLNEFIIPKKGVPRLFFYKAMSYFLGGAAVFMLSFPSFGQSPDRIYGYTSFSLCFGFFFPCLIMATLLIGGIRYLLARRFNVWGVFVYLLFLFLFSAICFAMTFFYDYENDSLASLLNYVCFGVTCLFGFNALIFSIFRLKTKFGVRG